MPVLQRFFEALNDAAGCVEETKHVDSDELLNSFRAEIFESFKEVVLFLKKGLSFVSEPA